MTETAPEGTKDATPEVTTTANPLFRGKPDVEQPKEAEVGTQLPNAANDGNKNPLPPQQVVLTAEQSAVLKEHNIEVPADGRISIADHVGLLNALSAERKKAKTGTEGVDTEAVAKEAADRVRAEMAADVTRANVVAAAATAGFSDPADAATLISIDGLDDEAKIKEAVEKLAKAKPYLLAKKSQPIPAGQQGASAPPEQTTGSWLRSTLTKGAQ